MLNQPLEVGKLEAEPAVVRAKTHFWIKSSLTAESIEQIKNPLLFKAGTNQTRPVELVAHAPAITRDEHGLLVTRGISKMIRQGSAGLSPVRFGHAKQLASGRWRASR